MLFNNSTRAALRLHSLSTTKLYTPLRPLTQVRNLLYVDSGIREMGMPGSLPTLRFWAFPPSIALVNYFTEWNLLNSLVFGLSIASVGYFMYDMGAKASRIALSLEVSADMSKFYFLMPRLSRNRLFEVKSQAQKEKTEAIKKHFENGYNPYIELHKEEFYKLEEKEKRMVMQEYYVKSIKMKVLREEIKRIFFLLDSRSEEEQLKADREKLEIQDFIRKYQEKVVVFEIMKDGLKYEFEFRLGRNAEKKFEDYLIALAGGFELQDYQPDSEELKSNQ